MQLDRMRPAHALWMSAGMLFADFLIDPAIQIPTVFVVPVAYAAWSGGLLWAFPLAVALPVLRMALVLVGGSPPWGTAVSVANAAIRLAVLLLVAYSVDAVAAQRRRVRMLEGLLPTCAHCRRIRLADGAWQQLERYVSDRSNVQFSHTICPTCAKEHYREFLDDGGQA